MELRIVSRPGTYRREYYVEERVSFLFFSWWREVGSVIGYTSEDAAKEFAEDYARGSWVSDRANFSDAS